MRLKRRSCICAINAQSDPGLLTVEAELTGHLNSGLFDVAWNLEIERHEMLRASVRERQNKGPLLVIWKKIHQPILFRDLSHLNETSKQQTVAEIIQQHRLDAQPDRALLFPDRRDHTFSRQAPTGLDVSSFVP